MYHNQTSQIHAVSTLGRVLHVKGVVHLGFTRCACLTLMCRSPEWTWPAIGTCAPWPSTSRTAAGRRRPPRRSRAGRRSPKAAPNVPRVVVGVEVGGGFFCAEATSFLRHLARNSGVAKGKPLMVAHWPHTGIHYHHDPLAGGFLGSFQVSWTCHKNGGCLVERLRPQTDTDLGAPEQAPCTSAARTSSSHC